MDRMMRGRASVQRSGGTESQSCVIVVESLSRNADIQEKVREHPVVISSSAVDSRVVSHASLSH